jgi:hypothetical protein
MRISKIWLERKLQTQRYETVGFGAKMEVEGTPLDVCIEELKKMVSKGLEEGAKVNFASGFKKASEL